MLEIITIAMSMIVTTLNILSNNCIIGNSTKQQKHTLVDGHILNLQSCCGFHFPCLWRMASATPDLRWYQICTAWWQL